MFELDNDGYPTDEWISFIKNFDNKTMPIMEFVELLRNNWWMSDWGFNLQRKYNGIRKLFLSTGGWSGNEETINAILSNFWLRNLLGYTQWNRGGHYIFEIPVKSAMQK
jgi:hypothetical protein